MIRVTPVLKSVTKTTSSTVQSNLEKVFGVNYIFGNRINETYLLRNNRHLHQSICQSNNLNIKDDILRKDETKTFGNLIKNGPTLKDFISSNNVPTEIDTKAESIPYVPNINGAQQKVYFEVYGCQMNVNDTEVAWSILKSHGYDRTNNIDEADIVLVVTCSIRDGAEQKIWGVLRNFHNMKLKRKRLSLPPLKVGVLGCMAERLKEKIIEKERTVDIIAGPDSYKDLPRLLANADNETAINVMLSFDETYADVMPVRLNPNSTAAFVTIMRGCDNMCTYCIVPFTRGRERSRPIESILREVQELSDQGIKEVTLLGQNVNSYRDLSESQFYTAEKTETHLATGFKTVYKKKKGGLRFVDLLDKVSLINPDMRIRFTSPHPKDFPDEVLHLIAARPNICQSLHVPAQSGNSAVLERMRRGYTREAYLELIDHIREVLPNVCLSTDMICGFCGETEEEFEDTLSLMDIVKYNSAFLFAYSMREKTTAHRRYKDDVQQDVKMDRMRRMWAVNRKCLELRNKEHIGQTQLVYIETLSKRSDENLRGRNDGNLRVIVPSLSIPIERNSSVMKPVSIGDFVAVKITDCSSEVLKGIPLYHTSLTEFVSSK